VPAQSAHKTARLVQRAQRGDEQAFADLYRAYSPQLYFFARKRLGSDEAAADVVQQVFLSVFTHLDTFTGPENFKAWCYKMCSNEITNVYRSNSRRPQTTSLDDMTEATQAANMALQTSDETSTSTSTITTEQRKELFACLDQLTEVQRDMMILHYYAQLQAKEIAFVTGATPEAVRKRLHDAHNALRKIWAKLHEAPTPDHETLVSYMEQGRCPQGKIAIGLGAALPAILGSAPNPTALSRAGLFLQAARDNNAAPVLGTATAAKAAGVALSTKIAAVAACVLVAAAASTGGYLLTRNTQPAQTAAPAPQVAAASVKAPTPAPATTPAPTSASASSLVSASQATPTPAPTPAPAPAPTPVRPTITVANPTVSYPKGTVLSAAQILADAGVSAKDAQGTPLAATVEDLAHIDTSIGGAALVFVHATDSAGTTAKAATITVKIT